MPKSGEQKVLVSGIRISSPAWGLMFENNQFRFDSLDFVQRFLKLTGFGFTDNIQEHEALRGRIIFSYFMKSKARPDYITILGQRFLDKGCFLQAIRHMDSQHNV
jgi:hypothetical protein